MKKIMVAMSGGIDSSVAAFLLKEAGYDVVGGMLKLHDRKDRLDETTGCCTTQDIEDARQVADKLHIPFHLFDYSADFDQAVIGAFINSYKNGGTPNPCVDCNKNIKFPLMLKEARRLGCDGIATGHYARIEQDAATGRFLLKKAVDLTKDQSYVLYGLKQVQLARILFPLGGMKKQEVRRIAAEIGLVTAHKSDSQDICFIPDGNYSKFIENYTGESFSAGDFVDEAGNVLGKHRGIICYTIGQRKGLGLALPAPMYVIKKDISLNQVVLGSNEDLLQDALDADQVNLIALELKETPVRVNARVRYKQAETEAFVTRTGEDKIHIQFSRPQRAVAKGQAVVLYRDDVVLGGATIL